MSTLIGSLANKLLKRGRFAEPRPAFAITMRALVMLSAMLATACSLDGPRKYPTAQADGADWANYGGTFDESHYSPLDEINDHTVSELGLAWSMDLPAQLSNAGSPLAIDGILYFAAGLSNVYAVDAATGRQIWHYDPEVGAVAGDKLKQAWGIRGIAYSDGRIYTGTQDGRLIAIDAATGQPAWSAQTTSRSDGLFISGPPRVFDGKVIIGNGGADFSAVRGYVTAYDARSGEQLWRFHTVPGDPAQGFENEAMEMAAKTWTGEVWKAGGGGTVWNAITYDPELGRIYIGTGNGSPWNAKIRSPGGGDNLFLCSIVALDAKTGAYVWHYQLNPGETWDFNAAMDIQLATLPIEGRQTRVILHAPKNGFFYVINRDSGKLISAEPFAKQTWAKYIDLETGRPVETADARRMDGGTIWPSGTGAHNWQPMAFSPKTRLVYIPTIEMPGSWDDRGISPATWKRPAGIVPDTSFNSFKVAGASPATADFGRLQAWDPIRQRQVWSVPLGAPYNGGVMATAGNVVFQGNAQGYFVAYSAANGTKLWEFDAQNGVIAPPITYLAKGKQYVTVLSGFGGTPGIIGALGAPLWDYRAQQRRVLTFALGATKTLPSRPRQSAVAPVRDPDFLLEATRAIDGEALFAAHCQICHGFGAVAGGTAPDLRISATLRNGELFGKIVRDGILKTQGMPGFHLSAQDAEALRHYLRWKTQEARQQ